MILIISIIAILAAGVGTGCYISKRRFEKTIQDTCVITNVPSMNVSELEDELDRIDELQNNLQEIRDNIENLDIPTPEQVASYDDAQSSLNKISQYFEQHSLATVGTEQFLLSLLPTSQIGSSIQAMMEVLPHDVGNAVFGEALASIKDSVASLPQEGLHRFVEGMIHLNPLQICSMAKAFEHHQPLTALITPIKSGVMEALGVHDATYNIAESLSGIGSDMASAVGTCPSVEELTNATDFDITGHIPVVTIALSSFREFQLLSDDKTDYITSLKNITLDAVGAGVGAAAGAKGGALLGSWFGPLGTVIGGIAGGIGGAIAGRFAANKVKMIPLNNAISAYETAYGNMKAETESHSRNTLRNIHDYAENKRIEFKNSDILDDIPVMDTSSTVAQIAVVIYQFIINEIVEMKTGIAELRNSIWYSEKKYGNIVSEFELQIQEIEEQLPSTSLIKNSPETVIDSLTKLRMPNRKVSVEFQKKIDECKEELKGVNDKNDSSVLMWSYMVNNLYQKTLNDIADFSNEQVGALNRFFQSWRERMESLNNDIIREKGKLGL